MNLLSALPGLAILPLLSAQAATGTAGSGLEQIQTVLVISRKGAADHSQYDSTSILQFLTRRFGLTPLAGVRQQMGGLSKAFAFP